MRVSQGRIKRKFKDGGAVGDKYLHELKKELQGFFSDGLVTIIGSGLSAAEGIPGMGGLACHLVKKVPYGEISEQDLNDWRPVSDQLKKGIGLEAALKNTHFSSRLGAAIRELTADLIRDAERSVIYKVIYEGKQLRLAALMKHYLQNKKTIPIITTNYDRLVELACEVAGLCVDNLFSGSMAARFDPRASRWAACRGYSWTSSRNKPAFNWANKAMVLKPHGSLDWFLGADDEPIRSDPDMGGRRLIITPGVDKYRGGYDRPFDAHRERANKFIGEAFKYLVIGYGFNDDHLETHLSPAIKSGKPTLIMVKELSEAAKRLVESSQAVIALSELPPGLEDGTLVTRSGSTRVLDGQSLWDLGVFVKEVLEP